MNFKFNMLSLKMPIFSFFIICSIGIFNQIHLLYSKDKQSILMLLSIIFCVIYLAILLFIYEKNKDKTYLTLTKEFITRYSPGLLKPTTIDISDVKEVIVYNTMNIYTLILNNNKKIYIDAKLIRNTEQSRFKDYMLNLNK